MLRVCKDDGIIRLTETSIVHQSNSPALQQFQQTCLTALQMAGYLPHSHPLGVIPQLDVILERHGIRKIRTKPYYIAFRAGTPECALYIQDVLHAMQTLRPFLFRWIKLGSDYEELYKQVQQEMSRPDFYATWQLMTIWGHPSW
jgi:hypothetical protein